MVVVVLLCDVSVSLCQEVYEKRSVVVGPLVLSRRQSNSFCTPHPHRWVLPVGLYVGGIPDDFCNRRICFVEDRFNYLAMENLQSHYGRFDS